jgi:hypothetical protein
LAGLLIGWLATYWCLTQGEYFQIMVSRMWARASAPSGIARHLP